MIISKKLNRQKYKPLTNIFFFCLCVILGNRRKYLISYVKFCKNMTYNLSQSFKSHILQGKNHCLYSGCNVFWWLIYIYLIVFIL